MNTVNENSTYTLTVTLRDDTGQPVVPSSVIYRVDDVVTGVVIKNDTAITPGTATFDITLASADVTIINNAASLEKKRLTVTATYDGTKKVAEEFFFYVKNLNKPSSTGSSLSAAENTAIASLSALLTAHVNDATAHANLPIIILDSTLGTSHIMGLSNGKLTFTETTTQGSDYLELTDSVTGLKHQMTLENGQLVLTEVS